MEWLVLQFAARFDTRREVVSQWRKRFFEKRLAGPGGKSPPRSSRAFPPELIVEMKALACKLPSGIMQICTLCVNNLWVDHLFRSLHLAWHQSEQ